jgi:hypothetical protein
MAARVSITGKYDFCHSQPLDRCSTYEIGQPQADAKKCECGK